MESTSGCPVANDLFNLFFAVDARRRQRRQVTDEQDAAAERLITKVDQLMEWGLLTSCPFARCLAAEFETA